MSKRQIGDKFSSQIINFRSGDPNVSGQQLVLNFPGGSVALKKRPTDEGDDIIGRPAARLNDPAECLGVENAGTLRAPSGSLKGYERPRHAQHGLSMRFSYKQSLTAVALLFFRPKGNHRRLWKQNSGQYLLMQSLKTGVKGL